MNKDQVRGRWEELKGKTKKEYGDATADRETQLEGAAQEGAGKLQKGIADAIEDVKDAFDKDRKEDESI